MAASTQFTTWLNSKLRELNTDETVFGSYIIGILEGDETPDEKREGLEGILSEILVSCGTSLSEIQTYRNTHTNLMRSLFVRLKTSMRLSKVF